MAIVSLSLFVHSAPIGEGGAAAAPCEDERVVCVRQDGPVLIAVLDGCGGTGARRYSAADNWSGARIASHTAGRCLYRWFGSLPGEHLRVSESETLAAELQATLTQAVREKKEELDSGGAAPVLISSRLSKALPTTLAALTAERLEESIRIRSYWAGNSRNYVFPPEGLRQLSADDLVGGYDPFEDLTKDGILSNSVNASAPFQIHSAEMTLDGPCMILSASDGVFSYFDSPIRLEWLLLETMLHAQSPAGWEKALRRELGELAADDHTLSLAALGFSGFSAMQKAYRPRYEAMAQTLIPVLQEASAAEDYERLQALWDSYKTDYLAVKREPDNG